jgi:nucleoside-diphosphate-sugar epimerase
MHVLMTGATGYVGPYVLDKLVQDGDDVKVLALPGTEDQLSHHDAVRVFSGSLDDLDVLARATRGVEVVYHLSGLYPDSPVKDMIRVNVGGTRNLLQASVAAGVRRVVYISSVTVYKPTVGPRLQPINENFPLRTSSYGMFGHYGLSKIGAEKLIKQFHVHHNIEYVVLRPTEIYGPPRWYFENLIRLVAHHPRLALSQSAHYGDMQWVHIRDLVNAVLLAGSRTIARNNIFNITGAEGFTVKDLIPIVWKLMGRENCWIDSLSVSTALKEKTRLKFDFSKARKILKFNPKITLEKGLRELVAEVKTKS